MLLEVDEMLDVIGELTAKTDDAGKYKAFKARYEALGTEMAEFIGQKLSIGAGDAHFEGAEYAGCCAGFWPLAHDQAKPEALEFYDVGGDWEFDDDE